MELLGQEVEEVMAAVSAVKRDILPGSVPQVVVEETTSAGTANKRVTWPMIAQSQRYVGGAERRGIRWLTVRCHKSASIVEKKVTPRQTVQNLRSAGDARRRVIWLTSVQSLRSAITVDRKATW